MSSESNELSGDAARPGRTYRSALRQQQAAETRLRVVAAATELFADRGYAGTTLAQIASAAGVSVETVQTQGSKAALMVAAVEYGAFGHTGDVNILDLDVGRRFAATTTPVDAIELFVIEQTGVHERSARVTRALFGAAANDPSLDAYLADVLASVSRQIRRVLELCRERDWLRDDVEFDELVGTTVVIAGIDSYLRLVEREGWSNDRYRAWFRRMLTESVFRPTSQRRRPR